MTTADDELLARFHERLAGIEALVQDPPPWPLVGPARVRGSMGLARRPAPRPRSRWATVVPVVGVMAVVLGAALLRSLPSGVPPSDVGGSLEPTQASAFASGVAALEVVAVRSIQIPPRGTGVVIAPTLRAFASYTVQVSGLDGTGVAAGRIDDLLTDPGGSRILGSVVLPAGAYQVQVAEHTRTVNAETGAEITDAPTASCSLGVTLAAGVATRLRAVFEGSTCTFDPPRTTAMDRPDSSVTPEAGRFPTGSPDASVSPDDVTETIGRYRITHPAAWTLVAGPTMADPFDVPIFYLSTEALTVGPCFTPNPAGEYQGCASPLGDRHLSPNGILITAALNHGLLERIPPKVNDIVPLEADCREMGADEEKEVVVNGAVVIACLRGPDLGALQAGFLEVVSAMERGSR